jgi:hypothetical protein
MGILYATLLGILILARLFILVKTGQLLPVAVSEKQARGGSEGGVCAKNSQKFAVNIVNGGNL